MQEDTRNIMGWPILIAVIDEQDTPPFFTIAPPTTALSPNLLVGDLILRVHAEDGDKGNPREIRYSLDLDGNRFGNFFSIDEITGTYNFEHCSNGISCACVQLSLNRMKFIFVIEILV